MTGLGFVPGSYSYDQAMADVELTRVAGDRRLYALEGYGTLRFEGITSRAATAEADGRRWRIARPRFWSRNIHATDELGTVVGVFEPRTFRRGGALRWAGRELALRPASSWRERYALADGELELAVIDSKGWGKRPIAVHIDDGATVEAALLLFAAFVVRGLADDANAAAASVSITTTG
jgi:hypothetical protein